LRNHSKIQRLKLVLFIWLILLSTLFFSTVLVFGAYQTDTQGGMYTVEYIPIDEIAYTASAINTKLASTENLNSITFDYDDGVTYEEIKANGTPYVGFPANTNGENISSYIVDNGTTKDVYFLSSSDIIAPTDCSNMFANLTTVTKIDLTNFNTSNTTSTDNMFRSCSNLSDVLLGNKITSIGSFMFYQCGKLTSLTIGSGVTNIVVNAFRNCRELTNVEVDINNSTYYSEGNCVIETASKILKLGSKTSIIPTDGSVTAIGNGAFMYRNIGNITIPNTITSIGSSAFENSGLTSIIIPTSIKVIPSYAFYACRSLKSVTISNGVTSIGDWAFDFCSALTSIEIPNSVIIIGNEAFADCDNLTSVTFRNTNGWFVSDESTDFNGEQLSSSDLANTSTAATYLTSTYCDKYWRPYSTVLSMLEFTLSSDGTSYSITDCDSSVSGCVTIPETYNGKPVTSIGESAFYYCRYFEELIIPDSITSIDFRAFYWCDGLKSVTIGSGVSTMSSSAFSHCSDLTTLVVDNNNTTYHSAGNCVIETARKTLVVGCNNSVIPTDGSVTEIGVAAFRGSDLLTIEIPDCVTKINDSAFESCWKLTNVIIGSGVTYIGSRAFDVISDLTSVTFKNPNGWFVASSSTATSGTNLSSEDLSNTSTAATYLTSTYCAYNKYWKRS